MTPLYNLCYIVVKFWFGISRFTNFSGGILRNYMWWKCDVQFCRTILRLKVWARNEHEARAKVERMYQVATIQNIALSDNSNAFPIQGSLAGPVVTDPAANP